MNHIWTWPIHFGRDHFILVVTKSLWSSPNQFGQTKTILDRPKLFWSHGRTRHKSATFWLNHLGEKSDLYWCWKRFYKAGPSRTKNSETWDPSKFFLKPRTSSSFLSHCRTTVWAVKLQILIYFHLRSAIEMEPLAKANGNKETILGWQSTRSTYARGVWNSFRFMWSKWSMWK